VPVAPDFRDQRIAELEAKVACMMKPHVTEYQLAEHWCECGARTRAELPMGLPAATSA